MKMIDHSGKKKLAWFCLFLFFVVFLSIMVGGDGVNYIAGKMNRNDIDLNLKLDQEEYQQDEPIQARLKIINAGVNSFIIKKRFAPNFLFESETMRDVAFIIQSPSGKQVDFNAFVEVQSLSTEDFVIMSPGETIEVKYGDLRDFYELSEPGRYTIQAMYENQSGPSHPNFSVWKGQVLSNAVMFLVNPKRTHAR